MHSMKLEVIYYELFFKLTRKGFIYPRSQQLSESLKQFKMIQNRSAVSLLTAQENELLGTIYTNFVALGGFH